MKAIIDKFKLDWTEKMDIKTDAYYCQQWLDKLDQLCVEYEARWGVGILENLVTKELKEKWLRHKEKINEAISINDTIALPQLVEGAVRGFDALEKEAMARGHKPHGAPVAWTVRMPCGQTLAICTTRNDAALVHGNKQENLVIWTLEEIARLVSKNALVNVIDAQKQEKKTINKTDINWKEGDSLPF